MVCAPLPANLRPRNRLATLIARLEGRQAVLEELGPLDQRPVVLYVDQNCRQPTAFGYEEDILVLSQLIELVSKLAAQVIRCNHPRNPHVNPIVDPWVKPGGGWDARVMEWP